MLGWVVGGEGDDCVSEGGFPVYGCHPIGGGLLDSDVEVIYAFVGFCFSSEFHVGMDCVEVLVYAINVCVVGVVDYQDIVHVAKISNDFVFI